MLEYSMDVPLRDFETPPASAHGLSTLAPKRSRNDWMPLALAAAATFLVPLDVTITAVALPAIERELHASFGELQWVINAYNIAYTACPLAVGTLADRYGRRLLFIAFLLKGKRRAGQIGNPKLSISRTFPTPIPVDCYGD